MLRRRAAVTAGIRAFFAERGVLEVSTDLIYPCVPTDPFGRCVEAVDETGERLGWLQPSPEFAMKRLLAAGSGDIFQIGKACRAGESGPLHRTEFTLVEWYRMEMDYKALAAETVSLVDRLLPGLPATQFLYADLWQREIGFDPFDSSDRHLADCLVAAGKPPPPQGLTERELRDLVFSELIEPVLPMGVVTLYDFPAEQTAMAKRRADDPRWAQRFEVFVNGVELANGYAEITDPGQQRSLFETDNRTRRTQGLPPRDLDETLLLAMTSPGLPECSGVALGLDRLLMLRDGNISIGADANPNSDSFFA